MQAAQWQPTCRNWLKRTVVPLVITIDKKMVSPAWMDVSKKYKSDAEAQAKLIAKVSNGSGGVWGKVPMPAIDPSGKKQDVIKELVQFILALDK